MTVSGITTDHLLGSLVEAAEKDCLKKEEELPLTMRAIYRSAIQSLISDMKAYVGTLRSEGKAIIVIESYLRQRCGEIQNIATRLVAHREECLTARDSVRREMAGEKEALEGCLLTCDAPLTKPLPFSLRIHPEPLRETDPALPRTLYAVSLKGDKTPVKDPLALFLAHSKTGSDFTICVDNGKGGSCKDIPLPKAVRENLIDFLRRHPDPSLWNCANFAAASQGEYKGKECLKMSSGKCEPVDFHTGEREWDFKRLGRTLPEDIKSGDYIAMEGGCGGHGALYLGEGFYLSKMGYEHGLAICKLEDMLEPCHRLYKFTSKPRVE